METRGIVGQSNISLEQCRSLIVSVPSSQEQREIIRRVEAFFALADRLEARCTNAKAHVDKLTQSILSKAFRGQLVETEAALAEAERREFESAAELLARLNGTPTRGLKRSTPEPTNGSGTHNDHRNMTRKRKAAKRG